MPADSGYMTIGTPEEHLDVRLVGHTHWDREWYHPAARFRERLVTLIDGLLERADDVPFLLDGQTVVLEDYLAVRPERAADLSRALRSGRFEAGPWFVLADGLLPGGEALVRNLQAGRRTLTRLRARAPGVLYCPDAFGHPGVLPLLATEFGLAVAVVWRGYGGRRWPPGDTVRWRAADGSETLLYHLPPDGYEFGAALPRDEDGAAQRWAAARQVLAARATLGVTLWPAGADHHAPPADLNARIALLGRVALPDRVVPATLGTFAEELVGRAAGRRLPVVRGELRDSYGYAWTLQGTLGARAGLKRRAAAVERFLLRDVEPWAALAFLRRGRSRGADLAAAWRPLLLCQPHDTLCGCVIDEGARAMATRLDDARAVGSEVRDRSVDDLLDHDPVIAREHSADWSPRLVIRNRSARVRSGLAEVEVDVVLGDVPVGPASAGAPAPAGRRPSVRLGPPVGAVQPIARELVFVREESPEHYPRNRLVERRRMLAWVENVPALGMVLAPIDRGRARRAPVSVAVRAVGLTLENGLLRVEVLGGRIRLERADGAVRDDLLGFELEGERGDLYTHSGIPGTHRLARLSGARQVMGGPLRGELVTRWEVGIPARVVRGAAGKVRRLPASRLRLRARLQLDAGAPFVRVLVDGDNRASDLRLRAVFRTGVHAGSHWADAAFSPVERTRLEVPAEDAVRETPPPTAPLHRYVSSFDDRQGCTVYSDGLTEYECTHDGRVCVTLVRAVGELSRADIPERPGHAGWPVETPLAQSQGPFQASFAVMPHGPRTPDTVAAIERRSDDILLPLVGHTWRTAIVPPESVSGVTLDGEGMASSAIVESQDGKWIVLRCANVLETAGWARWTVPGAREARLARLDEMPLGVVPVVREQVSVEVPPRGVLTLLVR